MNYTVSDVMDFIEDNDVKFIKLCFCDVYGKMKTISIIASGFLNAVENGVSFDASSVKGFTNVTESDLFLFPDLNTLSILPWRPQQGRVIRFYCDIKYPNGTSFEGDGRYLLKNAIKKLAEEGYKCRIGSESEFYLFELDNKGEPTKIPHDRASYLDAAPLDKGENVRRDICLTLEEMNIYPETSHHECGHGQNEIDFKYNNPLSAADDLVTFKSVVKTIAASNGLYASFMPKPVIGQSGSGLHVNLSLIKNNKNIFNWNDDNSDVEAKQFIAGVLNRVCEITLFLNPTANSYLRLGEMQAPKYVTWSHQNRSQLIRIPASNEKTARMELRSPDSSCNHYLAYALIIYAGLEGIKNKMQLVDPSNLDFFNATIEELNSIEKLPADLEEAVNYAKNSDFVKEYVPDKISQRYLEDKFREAIHFKMSDDYNDF